MRRLTFLVAVTAALLFPLSGVAHAVVEVTIGDDGLDPESVEADLNEDIVFTNTSDEDVSLVGFGQNLESGPMRPGATFAIKIVEKGTFEYESEDGSLQGEIIVAGGDQAGGEGDDEDPVEETNETGEGDGKSGNQGNGSQEREPLPETGIDVALPGALSVALILLGASLLLLTRPQRAA